MMVPSISRHCTRGPVLWSDKRLLAQLAAGGSATTMVEERRFLF